jgi:putative ABC transport system ATP-binding protein
MYKLTGVTRDYPKGRGTVHALQGVNLVIEDGEWLAIQGPTGHGKSTLLQILGGLDRPTKGVVELAGRNLARLGESKLTKVRASSIGFIFQTFNLIPTLSAQENVETALVPLKVPPAERRARAVRALTELGLGDRTSHLPSELSGGQQQRVAIARALVKRPSVLLADEPTGNLDSRTSVELMEIFQKLNDGGLTIILVTHEHDIAQFARRSIIFRDGRIRRDEVISNRALAAEVLETMPVIED